MGNNFQVNLTDDILFIISAKGKDHGLRKKGLNEVSEVQSGPDVQSGLVL